jgi:hypothetical protein
LTYGQFLVNSVTNFTGTFFANTVEELEHDSVYRYLKHGRMKPRFVWEKARQTLVSSPRGHLVFDDTVLDKRFSRDIDGARNQYSGNAHHLVTGIGVVNCLYYNPELDQFWVVDYRLFDPDRDGQTKLDHVEDMLKLAIDRQLSFTTVLMDTWYATTDMMRRIDALGKIFYCPLKVNRLVNDSGVVGAYHPVSELSWSETDRTHGKLVKVKKFPGNFKLKLFRITVAPNRTDYVVTNDLAQDSADDTRNESAMRWTIEQLHREEKQLTGIESCQARLNRSQRNHICIATLAWLVLKETARRHAVTIYQQKRAPVLELVAELWRHPATAFTL